MTSDTNKLNKTKKNKIPKNKPIKKKTIQPFFPPSLKAGLYIITCISTNRHYIGESDTVINRINSHKNQLRRGNHFNQNLQNDFDNYGENQLIFKRLFFGIGANKEKRQAF